MSIVATGASANLIFVLCYCPIIFTIFPIHHKPLVFINLHVRSVIVAAVQVIDGLTFGCEAAALIQIKGTILVEVTEVYPMFSQVSDLIILLVEV